MFAKLLCLTLLSATQVYAANTVAVFACPTKPTPGKDCLQRDLVGGGTLNIGTNDYYDVLINSVCIDEPDSWWDKKVISLSATISLASSPNPVKMPVYDERAAGGGCRIGVNHFALYTSIPANGTAVALQVDVMRSNDQNGLKQLLNFATSQESNPALTTYAVDAVPFLNMGLTFANQVYTAFGESTTPELPMTPTTLTPYSGFQANPNDLRDGYLVEYSGPDNPKDGDFYVDGGGDLHWSGNDSLVRGAVWVILRLRKNEHRTDYVIRPWYKEWYALLENVEQGAGGGQAVTADVFQKTTSDCIVLLEADGDFTDGDKRRFINSFTDVETSIVTELKKPSPDYDAIKNAITAALDTIELIQKKSDGTTVTATNSLHPTATAADIKDLVNTEAIVPSALAIKLKDVLQQ